MRLPAIITLAAVLAVGGLARPAAGQTAPADAEGQAPSALPDLGGVGGQLASRDGLASSIQWLLVITALSLAPAILIMVTSFTRIVVVLGLLRQALTTSNMPPNQVIFGLAAFMTLVIMSPVYSAVYRDAVQPYMDGRLDGPAALAAGERHVRGFLCQQVENAGNEQDVRLFLDESAAARDDLTWGDVPTVSLIPGYVVSELKVAFTMGFRIFLPFLVVDMLVASVLVSMGMLMVPPVLVSLPFKLLLFVLSDGWRLVVGNLMQSFR